MMLRWPEIIGILIVVLVLFGTRSFPEIAHRIGAWEGSDFHVLERALPWIICVLVLILVLGGVVHFLFDAPSW